jgi:hypothetical protein
MTGGAQIDHFWQLKNHQAQLDHKQGELQKFALLATAENAGGPAFVLIKLRIGDSDLINVRFVSLCGLKSEISRGPRSARTG